MSLGNWATVIYQLGCSFIIFFFQSVSRNQNYIIVVFQAIFQTIPDNTTSYSCIMGH